MGLILDRFCSVSWWTFAGGLRSRCTNPCASAGCPVCMLRQAAQPEAASLGLPAKFLFGGLARNERPRRIRLESGDVVVWGGPSRLAFH
jgi:hypothetical protein